MGLSFSRGASTPHPTKAETAPAAPVAAAMSRSRKSSDEGLVLTEPAMCAHCFDSIVAQFNGSGAATTAPSFTNSSQCVGHADARSMQPPSSACLKARDSTSLTRVLVPCGVL